jgi:hypothetical protein
LRKRRIAGSRSAVWRFFARRGISFKKTLYAAEQKRADIARARRRWMREQGLFDPALHRRNLHEHCDGAAARPCSAWRAARRLRAAWTLEPGLAKELRNWHVGDGIKTILAIKGHYSAHFRTISGV